MQGTRIRALVREDPVCRGAPKSLRHNYWACALEPVLRNKEKPPQWEARAPHGRAVPCLLQLEKARAQQRRPNAAKKNKKQKTKDALKDK